MAVTKPWLAGLKRTMGVRGITWEQLVGELKTSGLKGIPDSIEDLSEDEAVYCSGWVQGDAEGLSPKAGGG